MRVLTLLACSLVALALAGTALASQVVSTSTGTNVKLGVNDKGEAMLSYTQAGKPVRVLAFGAVNAIPSTTARPQLKLTLSYDGGYQKQFGESPDAKAAMKNLRDLQAQLAAATAKKDNPTRWALAPKIKDAFASLAKLRAGATDYWKTFSCPRYDGPPLAWAVAACKAPDGSYWAVQSWQRLLPNYGLAPTPTQAAWEIHLSHWSGELPVLEVGTDWAWRQWDHLYGRFTYRGAGVYGFKSTSVGQPLDTFGRNLYVDTLDSVYGKGWKRENSFLTHTGNGVFCYSVNPHGEHPSGKGTRYRATIIGPGLTPDIMWEGASPGPFDAEADAAANAKIAALGDRQCRPN